MVNLIASNPSLVLSEVIQNCTLDLNLVKKQKNHR